MQFTKFLGAAILAWVFLSAPAWAQTRITALIATVGGNIDEFDVLRAELSRLGAETLVSADPNNAELRNLVRRFADAASDTDVAFVFIHAPVVSLDQRGFVAPDGLQLRRAEDVLTRALPVSAFARAAALAGEGGIVFLGLSDVEQDLPAALDIGANPLPARPGASPVVVGPPGLSWRLATALAEGMKAEEVELSALVARAVDFGSALAPNWTMPPVYLRRARAAVPARPAPDRPSTVRPTPAEPAEVEDPAVSIAPVPAPEPEAQPATPAPVFSIADLEAIERALSRSRKRALQRALQRRGHYDGLIDGIFGGQTRRAIRSFQSERGGETTGFLTPSELAVLLDGT